MNSLVLEVCVGSAWAVAGGSSFYIDAQGQLVSRKGEPFYDLTSLELSVAVLKAAVFAGDEVQLMDPTGEHDGNWRLLAALAPDASVAQPRGGWDPWALEMLDRHAGTSPERLRRLASEVNGLLAQPVKLWSDVIGPDANWELSVLGRTPEARSPRILDPSAARTMAEIRSPTPAFIRSGDGSEEELSEISSRRLQAHLERAYPNLAMPTGLSLAQQALGVAPLYVLRAVPNIGDFSVERILMLRDELSDSLGAYRAAVARYLHDSTTVEDENAAAFLQEISTELDRAYEDLLQHSESATLTMVAAERLPVAVGAFSALAYTFGASAQAPVASLHGLAAGSLAYALSSVAESLRRMRRRKSHPLFWRYTLDGATAKHRHRP